MRWLLIVCMCCGTLPLIASEYFVALHGSDSSSGSIDQPWRTISYAVQAIDSGTVTVLPGEYRERVFIDGARLSGPVTIQGRPGAIIDGSDLETQGMAGLITIAHPRQVMLTGLELRHHETADSATTTAGVYVYGAGAWRGAS